MEFSKDLKLAIEAAKEAGKILKKGFGNFKTVSEKPGKGIVTEIDKASEDKILAILRRESEYSIYAEESGRKDNKSNKCWIIDPLDGTTNFVRSIPLFCSTIALMENNELSLGVTYNPLTHDCFFAEKGKGAFLNDQRIKVSQKAFTGSNLVLLSSGYASEHKEIFGKAVLALSKDFSIRKLGTTALELCFVAQGNTQAFLCSGDELYDYAAGLLLVREAGGKVTDWKGNDWNNSNSYILASNGVIHDQIISKIKDLQNDY